MRHCAIAALSMFAFANMASVATAQAALTPILEGIPGLVVPPPDNVAGGQAPPDQEPGPAAAPSPGVIAITNWVISRGDNGGLPFIIIDKVAAELLVFDAVGQLMARRPALLGSASGDESTPGVGDRELSAISPEERTTPAGRFVAKFGTASGRRRVLWVDYPTAISLHPVVTANRKEHRKERLGSPEPDDNRITYGCINVEPTLYRNVIQPLFEGGGGIVYILPETKPLGEVFLALR